MNYLVNPDMSEEIDERETDPLTGNIIGAAIDVHRAKMLCLTVAIALIWL